METPKGSEWREVGENDKYAGKQEKKQPQNQKQKMPQEHCWVIMETNI